MGTPELLWCRHPSCSRRVQCHRATLHRATVLDITTPLDTATLALGAFAGTNIDGLVTLSGQLVATDHSRHRRISEGQLTATLVVIGLCALGGVGLQSLPHRVLGLLGLIPLILGLRAGYLLLKHRSDDRSVPGGGGFLSSFGVTLAISGDNVAIYLPILATGTLTTGTISITVWILADLVLIAMASFLGRHEALRSRVGHIGPVVLPIIYLAVGIVVLVKAGTFS